MSSTLLHSIFTSFLFKLPLTLNPLAEAFEFSLHNLGIEILEPITQVILEYVRATLRLLNLVSLSNKNKLFFSTYNF